MSKCYSGFSLKDSSLEQNNANGCHFAPLITVINLIIAASPLISVMQSPRCQLAQLVEQT